MFESFLSIHAGDEDLLRPVLDHFLGDLPDVITTGDALPASQRWHRAGQTPRARHGARFHLDRAKEHLSLSLHITRVDPLPDPDTTAAPSPMPDVTVPLAGDPAAAIIDAVAAREHLNGLTLDMGLLSRLEQVLDALDADEFSALAATDRAQILTLAAQSRSHTVDALIAYARALA